jgi:methionine--tRNA ligase beta chain
MTQHKQERKEGGRMSVSFRDFEKLIFRVGKITGAERIAGKKRIFKVLVDVGDNVAQAIAGGGEFYEPSSLVGKQVIVVTNMEAKTIAGIRSEVMLLAADLQGKPIWATVESDVPAGTKVR